MSADKLPSSSGLLSVALVALALSAACPTPTGNARDAGDTATLDATPLDQGWAQVDSAERDVAPGPDTAMVADAASPDQGARADGGGGQDLGTAADAALPRDAAAPADSATGDATVDASAGDDAGVSCALPPADLSQIFDFATDSYTPAELNSSTHFIRTVFGLTIPDQMERVSDGLRLVFDAAALPAGVYLDYSHRSELRETDNSAYPATGSTQIYRLVFSVEDDLDPRQGPGTIVQRFNRDVDGPDCEVELTGIGQFSGDDDTPYLQTVCFGQRVRHAGVYLQPRNELLLAVYNAASDGAFGIWLNGQKLDGRSGIDTLPSTSGTWLQFGQYEHGLIYDNADRRAAQVASGSSRASYVYHRFEKHSYAARLDLSALPSYDPNAMGYQCR